MNNENKEEKKKFRADEFALSKFRFQELKYFTLQYNYWVYVIGKLETGEWDMTREIARRPRLYYQDPTSAGAVFKAALKGDVDLVNEALGLVKSIAPEFKEYLKKSVTTEISWTALSKEEGLTVDQEQFYRARMEFYYHLDRIK